MKNKIYFIARQFLFLILVFTFSNFYLFAQKDTGKNVSNLSELTLEQLMNIKVVTASGSEQTMNEAPSTIRVITAQQIEERGYEQLEDVLRDIEGVDLIHMNGYMPTLIYFRGMYGAENLRTLLMIDGVRENNIAGTNDLAGPAYSLHNVERIEIIWGPASALYGADAFGGVINIITKKGADINGLHVEQGFGNLNTSFEKAMLGIKKSNFDMAFSGSLYSTDGPRFTNRDPYYTGGFVDKAWSFNGNISHTYKKFKNTLCLRAFDTPMSFGNFLNSSTKALGLPSQGYGNSGALGVLSEDVRGERPSLYETYSYTTFLQTEYTVSSKLSLLARVSYRETGISDKSYVYLSLDTTFIDPTNNKPIPIDSTHILRIPIISNSNRVKGEISANYSLSSHHKFFAGIQIYEDNVEQGNRGEILDTNKYMVYGIPVTNLYPVLLPRKFTIRDNFGSFIQYELSTNFLHKTNVTVGARYDKNTDYENPISPRIAVINQPNDKFTFKLLYGTAFRAPTPTEVASEIQTFGSKALNPEKVSTWELNVIYNPSNKYLVQVNGFSNELKDIFVLNSLLGGGFQQKQSLGSAMINGAELRMDLFLSKHFSGFLNFTYQQGIQKDSKNDTTFDIPDIPNMKGNIGLTFHVAELFTLTVISNWVGDRTLPSSNPYGEGRGYKMNGYFVTNAVLTTKKLFDNRVTASLNIRNLFNSSYLDPGIRTADGFLYSTVLEQPGRTGVFKVTVNF